MDDPDPETLPISPEALDASRLPAWLRDNPGMQLYLRLDPERRAVLDELAARTASEDGAVVQQPVANLR